MVKVAILGFGTVGSGVAELLSKNGGHIAQKVETPVELKYILDLRDFPDSPFGSYIIHEFATIESDPEIDIVVETIGGTSVALEFTKRALSAGKSVISSNKEVVAQHGYELLQLAAANNVSYLFEASVGGGIPILRPLSQCLAANELMEICGILNGTTNYILTRMIRAGLSFEAALKEAQDKGYAELNPAADVEGLDACRKICILSALGFGRHLYPHQVPTEGITGVTLEDVAYAEAGNYKIKLLGRAIRQADDRVCAYVAPHLVPAEAPLAGVEDVFNAITVKGDAIGDVMFYGRGAGKLPTASAVVADVMDAARRIKAPKRVEWSQGGEDVVCSVDGLESCWYVRGTGEAPAGLTLLQKASATPNTFAGLTQPMTRSAVEGLCPEGCISALFRVLD